MLEAVRAIAGGISVALILIDVVAGAVLFWQSRKVDGSVAAGGISILALIWASCGLLFSGAIWIVATLMSR